MARRKIVGRDLLLSQRIDGTPGYSYQRERPRVWRSAFVQLCLQKAVSGRLDARCGIFRRCAF